MKRYGLQGEPFGVLLPPGIVEEIRSDLLTVAKNCSVRNSPDCLEEFFFITERQNMIAYIPAVMELVMPVVCPFEQPLYREFFLGLPRHLRVARRLFRTASRNLLPQLLALPSTADESLGLRRLARTADRRLRTALQIAMDILTQGRFVKFSPYTYEQHHYVANRILRPQITSAAMDLAARVPLPAVELVNRALQYRIRRPDLALGIFSIDAILAETGS